MKKSILFISLFLVLPFINLNAQISFSLNGAMDYGLGGKIKLRTSEGVNVEIGGGINPILTFWEVNNFFGDNDTYFKFYMAPSFGGAISFPFSKDGEKKQLDFKMLAIYNNTMDTGIGFGVDYLFNNSDNNLWLTAGVIYYNNAYNNLFNDLIESEDLHDITKDNVSALLVNFRPYLGISLEL